MATKSAAQRYNEAKDKEPTPVQEDYRLALESVLRWTNRQGYPSDKIRAIRKVVCESLLRQDV